MRNSFKRKIMVRIVSLICAMMVAFTSPFVKYLDSNCINKVYATGLEIPVTVAGEAVLEYLLGFFATLALGDAAYENRDAIAKSYMEYIDIKIDNDQLTQDTCMMIYDKTTNVVKTIPWEDFRNDLKNVHDISVDKLTDVYAKYCPQLLGSMKGFVSDVLNGNVYVAGFSDVLVEYDSVTTLDIADQWNGQTYTLNACLVRGPLNCSKCKATKLTFIYGFNYDFTKPMAFLQSTIDGRTDYCSYDLYNLDDRGLVSFVNISFKSSCPFCGFTFLQTYNPFWHIGFSANVPIFCSYGAVQSYLQTGAGYEDALNFSTSMDDEIIDMRDIPLFTKPWQQEQWERVANASDVIGIGSYGMGTNVDGWAEDIPWIGLDSLQEYVDTIPSVYDKVVDNVISGTYDSNKDIPETYSDAWEYAVSEAWANVKKVESLDSGTGEDTEEKDGEDNTEIIELSENNIQHIKKHTFDGMAEQAQYLTDEQLDNKLENTTFFNKTWTFEEVVSYTQTAYNILKNQGKTGLQPFEINGEIIYIFIDEDGAFGTAYGIYRYTVEDFR